MNNRTLAISRGTDKPWVLVLRGSDSYDTMDYVLCGLSDITAREVARAGRGSISSPFCDPDWERKEEYRKRELERARALRAEAEKIEAANR